MKYKTVNDTVLEDFDTKVSYMMSAGWAIIGHPYVSTPKVGATLYCQAMIKLEEGEVIEN